MQDEPEGERGFQHKMSLSDTKMRLLSLLSIEGARSEAMPKTRIAFQSLTPIEDEDAGSR